MDWFKEMRDKATGLMDRPFFFAAADEMKRLQARVAELEAAAKDSYDNGREDGFNQGMRESEGL